MRENRIKQKLSKGEVATVISGYLMNADLIEFFGQFGFDGAWIECEHGPVTWDQIGDLSRACDLWNMTALVRVPTGEPWVITRTLDRGAAGIVVPHVNTREQAERIVRAAKFGPIGTRGMYGGRRSLAVEDYFQTANDQTVVMVLIEEVEAVKNLPEILKVDHIDVFFVAPGDLGQTMGFTGQLNHPKVLAAVEDSIRQIVAAGRVAGTLAWEQTLDHYLGLGARFVMTPWNPWAAAGARSYLARIAAQAKVQPLKRAASDLG